MMDGDGAHSPKNVLQMLQNLNQNVDFVVGSRYIKGGKIKSFLIWRRFISLYSNWLIRAFISNKIHDWTSGFMAIKMSKLEVIYKYDYAEGFSFLVQLKRNLLLVGANVFEVPIVFANHDEKSKFNTRIALEAFGVFLKIIFEGKRGKKN
jgi:dolichol-phosphate mannosyltransferase